MAEKGLHKVELIEVEMTTQESFFDYVKEDLQVFDNAYAEAFPALKEHQGRQP